MTVKQLKEALEDYDDESEVVIVDCSNGEEFEPTVGSDDEDEYTTSCRIGI